MKAATFSRWSGLTPGRWIERKAVASRRAAACRRAAALQSCLGSVWAGDKGSSCSALTRILRGSLVGIIASVIVGAHAAEHALVLQTDFGLKDGAVGAMRGVAAGVSLKIPIHDLSHDNTPFNLW